MSAFLHAFGVCLPDRVVTNVELEQRTGRTAEWIENASGIRERRWAAPETSAADLAVAAARDCLTRASVAPASIGMLIVSSGSAARGFPGPAAEVAAQLGLGTTPALDVPIASAGSLFALALASHCATTLGDVLVVAGEKMSDMIGAHGDSPLDPNIGILFGDGAGAALVSSRPGPWKIVDSVLHTDGQFRGDLKFDGDRLHMNGLSVILQASRKLPSVIQEVLDRNSTAATDVALYLLHQANLNLLTRVAKALEVDSQRVPTNVQRYGNTSSASMLILAAEQLAQEQAIRAPLVFAGFGAGFHWGALLASPS